MRRARKTRPACTLGKHCRRSPPLLCKRLGVGTVEACIGDGANVTPWRCAPQARELHVGNALPFGRQRVFVGTRHCICRGAIGNHRLGTRLILATPVVPSRPNLCHPVGLFAEREPTLAREMHFGVGCGLGLPLQGLFPAHLREMVADPRLSVAELVEVLVEPVPQTHFVHQVFADMVQHTHGYASDDSQTCDRHHDDHHHFSCCHSTFLLIVLVG